MQSNQIARSIIKRRLSGDQLNFYDQLSQEEQEFVQLVVLSQPRALEVDIDFPKVTFFLLQHELSENDANILNSINNLSGNKLEIRIFLDEILIDKKQPDYLKDLQEFDIKKHRHEDDLIFRSELYRWRSNLRPYFLSVLSSKLKDSLYWTDLPYTKLLENLHCYNSKCDDTIFNLIKVLIPSLSIRGKLLETYKEVNENLAEAFIRAIVELEPEHGFVLRAFAFANVEEVEFLFKIMDRADIKQIDTMGNTALHLVNKIQLFRLAMSITSDINQVNLDGNTALHCAVELGDDSKVGFLLLKEARTDIQNNQGKICWAIEPLITNEALEIYKKYAVTGFVISFFCLPALQTGLCCGLYAAAFVINYYSMLCADILNQQRTIARKCDLPGFKKDGVSLRELAKKKGITIVGEILSMDALAEMINDANCPTELYKIESYEAFMSVLQKAAMRKQPVIIPYALVDNDMYDEKTPVDAFKAHLATCIGVRCNDNGEHFLLLAHQGGCQELNARFVFHTFYNIADTIPTLYFYKINGEWQKFLQPQDNLSAPSRILNTTSLSMFRRRLLVAKTPLKPVTQILQNTSSEESLEEGVGKHERSAYDQDIQPAKRTKTF